MYNAQEKALTWRVEKAQNLDVGTRAVSCSDKGASVRHSLRQA